MASKWIIVYLAFLSQSSATQSSAETGTFTFTNHSSLLQFQPKWTNEKQQSLKFQFKTRKSDVLLVQHRYKENVHNYQLLVWLGRGQLYVEHAFKYFREKFYTLKDLNDNKWHTVSIVKDVRAGIFLANVDGRSYQILLEAYTKGYAFNFIQLYPLQSEVTFGGLPLAKANKRSPVLQENYFIGCISEIVFLEANQILHTPIFKKDQVLDNCTNKCEEGNVCKNKGACINYYSHAECDCFDTGYEGDTCEISEISTVTLRGYEWLTYDLKQHKGGVESSVSRITLSFKTSNSEGPLLHISDPVTDVRLNAYLHQAQLKIVLASNTDPYSTRHTKLLGTSLQDERWHNITFTFNEYLNEVVLDKNAAEVLTFPTRGKHMFSVPSVAFGGNGGGNTHGNFIGCLRNLYVNHISVISNLSHKEAGYHGIQPQHGCSKVDPSIMSLTRKDAGFRITHRVSDSFHMSFEFRTLTTNNMLVYHEFLAGPYKKYLQVQLFGHHVILTVTPGDISVTVDKSHSRKVIWNWISINVTANGINLKMNNISAKHEPPQGKLWFLKTTYLGALPSSNQTGTGFVGCLRNITIQGEKVNYVTAKESSEILLDSCDFNDLCQAEGHIHCQNGGRCMSDWYSTYCDCTGTGYEGPTCSISRMRQSCDDYYHSGDQKSGLRQIDPDRGGPLPPVYVYCKMGVVWPWDGSLRGVTVIKHNLKQNTIARKHNLPSHRKRISYRGMDWQGVLGVVDHSFSCRQKVEVTCRTSPIRLGKLTWFQSPRNNFINSLGSDIAGQCGCEDSNSCVDTRYKCNCDQRSGTRRSDGGYHYQTKSLPITEMTFKESFGELNVTLGPLECIGHNIEVSSAVRLTQSTSFLALPSWSFGSLYLDFRTTNKSGVLIYQAARIGSNHNNLTIFLKNKHTVTMNFFVDGAAHELRVEAHRILNDGNWQQLALERDSDKLRLQINNNSAWFDLDTYDFEYEYLFAGYLYLGGSPSLEGIMGCMRRVYYNDEYHDLKSYFHGSMSGVVSGCESLCDSNPCKHGSQCIEMAGTYQCVCQNKYAHLGRNCETDINANSVTLLTLESYLQYQVVLTFDLLQEDIVFSFRTYQAYGVLLHMSTPSRQSYIMIRIQAGSEMVFTYKTEKEEYEHFLTVQGLNDGEWKQVVITKENGSWFLIVDEVTQMLKGLPAKPSSKTTGYDAENKVEPHTSTAPIFSLYFGGIPDQLYSPLIGIIGCLRGLKIGPEIFDPLFSIRTEGIITGCVGGCDVSPCENNGVCQEYWQNNYTCDCTTSSYSGRNCNEEVGGSFHGDTYIRKDLSVAVADKESLLLTFASRGLEHTNPMILAHLHGKNYEMYMTVGNDVTVNVRLGNIANYKATIPGNFSDGGRHRVNYWREQWHVFHLKVDGKHKTIDIMRLAEFASAQWLDIGGSREKSRTNYINFTGCISNVEYKTENYTGESKSIKTAAPLHEVFGYIELENTSVIGDAINPDFCGVAPVLISQMAAPYNMVSDPPPLTMKPAELVLLADKEPEAARSPPPNLGLTVGLPVAIILFLLLLLIIAICCCCRRIKRKKKEKLEFSKPDEEQGLVKDVPSVKFEPCTNGLQMHPAGTHKKKAKILASMEDLSDVGSVDSEDQEKPRPNDRVPLLIVSPPSPQRQISEISDIPLIDDSRESIPGSPDQTDKPDVSTSTPEKMADVPEEWDPDVGQSPINMKPLTTSTPYPVADVKRRGKPGRSQPEYSADSGDVLAAATPSTSKPYSEVWTESQVLTMLEDKDEEDAAEEEPIPGPSTEPQTTQEPPDDLSEPSEPYITASSGDACSSPFLTAEPKPQGDEVKPDRSASVQSQQSKASELDAHEKDTGTEKGQHDLREKEILGKPGSSPGSSQMDIAPNGDGVKMTVPAEVHIAEEETAVKQKINGTASSTSLPVRDSDKETRSKNNITESRSDQENKQGHKKGIDKPDIDTDIRDRHPKKTFRDVSSPVTDRLISPNTSCSVDSKTPMFSFDDITDYHENEPSQRDSRVLASLPEGTKILSPPFGVSPGIPEKKGKKKYKKNQKR